MLSLEKSINSPKKMFKSEKLASGLYQALGKLFYAVAMADKKVRPIEIEKLKEAVKESWLEVDAMEDEFGTDAAYQIEIVFDWLLEREGEAQAYFEEFKEFFNDHTEKFDPKLRDLIWKTANTIAASYAGMNKSELMVLGKLQLLLQQKKPS
jgi:oligoendopeptidase F